MHLEKDESDFLYDTHGGRPYTITDMHTGHRFAGERARHHADQDQSTAVHSARTAHDALLASGVMDVGGRRRRTEHDLKNLSTSLPPS